jgi:hypothetical protein
MSRPTVATLLLPLLAIVCISPRITGPILAGAASEQDLVVHFQSGNVTVLMTIRPVRIEKHATLKDGETTIENFSGVQRTVDYKLESRGGRLPLDLKVRETLQITEQSHYPDYDILKESQRTVAVGTDGTFSDLIALGTTDDSMFPTDFRQTVRQSLYIVNGDLYRDSRLLAVLSIERRTFDIRIGLVWPHPAIPSGDYLSILRIQLRGLVD